MLRHNYRLGERVIVTKDSSEARGWLELADDEQVVVRLPSKENPESPGDELQAFTCKKTNSIRIITCTAWYDHFGVGIGYIDPPATRTRFFKTGDQDKDAAYGRLDARVREMSLAVPLAKASVDNDWARMPMVEAARAELGMPPLYPRNT